MRAIILAAGRGARLGGIAGDDPKCLVKVGGLTLMERQIATLKLLGLDRITAVVGFGAARVRTVCGGSVDYVENESFDRTNSLYSLWLTRRDLSDGFVVLNSDVLVHPRLVQDLLASPHENALLIDYRDERTAEYGDEEMKVRVRDGRIIDISKEIAPASADGENVGIAKFGPEGARLLIEEMDALISTGYLRHWAPRAFREFALKQPLHAVATRGLPWIEIDFPEDYSRAVNEILPRLAAEEEHLIMSAATSGD
ncbi:MAG TPA: phosphocholine cytidylyltransferase family protein [Blastocatellia bacterium]|nr:phosphocholine cytidylyltransferase family protein [Blastocatellia bacterium]